MRAEPYVEAQDGATIRYSEARTIWETGEFSDWVEEHGGFPVDIDGDECNRNECELALSDDSWDDA